MTLAIAHRGEPGGHIENTLDSFQAAIDAGAPMLEIDVRLTADGRPVVIHDADLTRIWGVSAPRVGVDQGRDRARSGRTEVSGFRIWPRSWTWRSVPGCR